MRITILFYLSFYTQWLNGQDDMMVLSPVNNTLLQQCDIRNVTIGQDGKLWLSTNKGIAGYDGHNVQMFSEHGIFGAFSDKINNLYLIETSGIYYFNTKTGKEEFLNITVDPERYFSDPRTYNDIFVDDDGSIWCGRTDGFLRYNNSSKETTFYGSNWRSNKDPIAVRHIQRDAKNSDILWLATNDGIYRFNKSNQEYQRRFNCTSQKDSSGSDAIISRMHVTADTIWFVGNNRGVGCYDIKKAQYTIFPSPKNIFNDKKELSLSFLQPKNSHEYYVGSADNCPGIFNILTHQYTINTRTHQQLPALSINQFIVDSSGNMWCIILGQLYHGNNKQNRFTTLLLKDQHSKTRLKNIFKTTIWGEKRKLYYSAFDNSDVIFVCDSNMKLLKSIPIVDEEIGTEQRSEELHIYDISLDNSGRLWACGTSLYTYDSLRQIMVPANKLYKNLQFHDQRFQNVVSRKNYLYLQPSNPAYQAIYRVSLTSYTYDSITIPYEIIPLGYENSWKGRNYHEVAVFDKQGEYAYIGIDNYILQLNLQTKKGKKITRVTLRDNAYYFNMFWYALDDDNNLWFTSSEGVKKINLKSLRIEKIAHHGYHTNRFQIYNADETGIMCLLYSEGILLFDYRNNKEYHLSLSDGLVTLFNSALACVNNTLFVGAQLDALQYLPVNSIIHSDKVRKCYLSGIQLFNTNYITDTLPEYLHSLVLPHNKNFITLTFSSTEFERPEQLAYRYKLSGVDEDWVNTNYLNRTISYNDLKPGNYVFYTSIKNRDGSWNDNKVNLHINIIPAWWQTSWFKILAILSGISIILGLAIWRIRAVRKQERLKATYEKELLELEAKALRAQMNPHFVFNSLNSIKSLINKNENANAAEYLTTFSKLIRTLFQNSDKREISLHEELETCRLYTQIEKMRFGDKVNFKFDIDSSIDLKDINVPALILQPFIENAIWHGLVPKESGGMVSVSIKEKDGVIECIIDDDGIGRALSMQYKTQYNASHESKGIGLTRSRLEIDKLLNNREDIVTITDKIDNQGKPSGTNVVLTFKDNVP